MISFVVHATALFIVLILAFAIPSTVKKVEKPSLDIVGIVLFIAALVLLLCFVAVEKRLSHPMVNFELLGNYYFLSMILIPVVASFCFVTLLTWFPTWLIAMKSLSPLESGLVISLVLFVDGLLLLWICNLGSMSMWQILLSLLLVGAGMGLSAGLVDGIALSVVSTHEVGRAAGILNTFRLGSEAIAVAIYGSLMSTGIFHSLSRKPVLKGVTENQYLADVVSGNAFASAGAEQTDWLKSVYTQVFSNTLLVLLIISLVISLSVVLMIRYKKVNI